MFKTSVLLILACFVFSLFSGCTVRTYSVTKERLDQDLTLGNRGYLRGQAEAPGERKTIRQIQVIEMETHSIQFGSRKSAPSAGTKPDARAVISEPEPVKLTQKVVMERYTVQKGDTLQSISKKFYGTTKRWQEIHNANKGVLKSENKIYPGQVIQVPLKDIKGIK